MKRAVGGSYFWREIVGRGERSTPSEVIPQALCVALHSAQLQHAVAREIRRLGDAICP